MKQGKSCFYYVILEGEEKIMEIKINKDVRQYQEYIFWGMSFRQCLFILFGCVLAVITYMLFVDLIGLELTSWLCIISAIPSILFGFISFQGLPFEKVIVIIIKSMILNKRKLTARESMRMRRKLRKRNCSRRL